MYNLKDMVIDNKKVHFSFYREKELWYKTECGFEFPVPIDDIGGAIFLAEDKALLFMRYIRKHIASLDTAKQEQATVRVGTEIVNDKVTDLYSDGSTKTVQG